MGSAAGQTCPFSRVILRLTLVSCNCQSCYMYFSNMFHAFLNALMCICQSCYCPFSRVIHRLTLSTFAASPDQLLKGHGTETMSGKKKPNNWSRGAFIAQVLGSYKIKVFWVSLFTDQVTRPWTLNPWSTCRHEKSVQISTNAIFATQNLVPNNT